MWAMFGRYPNTWHQPARHIFAASVLYSSCIVPPPPDYRSTQVPRTIGRRTCRRQPAWSKPLLLRGWRGFGVANGRPAPARNAADGVQRRAVQAAAGLLAQQLERGREHVHTRLAQLGEKLIRRRVSGVRGVCGVEVAGVQQTRHV